MLKVLLFLIAFLSFETFAYEKTDYGPWLRSRWGKEYRYVSTYQIRTVSQPAKNFPWFEEDCHDDGETDFTHWNHTLSYEISYNGSIGIEFLGISLGLGGEVGRAIEFGFERWIHATAGVRARHVLHEEFDIIEGFTRKEIRSSDGEISILNWESPFEISHINYGLYVKRNILEICEEPSP